MNVSKYFKNFFHIFYGAYKHYNNAQNIDRFIEVEFSPKDREWARLHFFNRH